MCALIAKSGRTAAPQTPTAARTAAPRCIIVTGPRRAGKTRWLQETIHTVRADQPSARFAVLSAEEGTTRMERFAQNVPGITVHRLFLPCPCCPAAADLPRYTRALIAESKADWLFFELPVLPAIGLIAEFDTHMRWLRKVVVCLNAGWATARRTGTFSYFQTQLVEGANRVIEPSSRPTTLILS